MKITHLSFVSTFSDGYSYQENILPLYHKKLGHEVSVITSQQVYNEEGELCFTGKTEYLNEYGIPVLRLKYKKPVKIYVKLRRFSGLYEALEKAEPDILFIHGCQFLDIDVVVEYLKKHPRVSVYVDNHADFSNSARNWLSLNILHKILWKRCAWMILPFTTKFYGVLPARVDFLKDLYCIPGDKTALLLMGAEDDLVASAGRPEVRNRIRKKYNIGNDDFLIVTGGKIDSFKKQTLLLMDAVNRLKDPKVRLIVFGSVVPELRSGIRQRLGGSSQYIGWIGSVDAYEVFAAADLVVFPGRHSVFWEQAAGLGKPLVCKYWEGTDHVDLGGNVKFITQDSVEAIFNILKELRKDPEEFRRMKETAEGSGKERFSYLHIARMSIGKGDEA
ncbi:glycosyltransferase family 4 protein [bacterium]|nr:glycosyltransferase family 4 protein [bacterium]